MKWPRLEWGCHVTEKKITAAEAVSRMCFESKLEDLKCPICMSAHYCSEVHEKFKIKTIVFAGNNLIWGTNMKCWKRVKHFEHKRSNLTDCILISIKCQLWRLKETGKIQPVTIIGCNEVWVATLTAFLESHCELRNKICTSMERILYCSPPGKTLWE